MSRLQKAIAASKATREEKLASPRSIARSLREAVTPDALIKKLLPADVDTDAMARSGLLPGVDDKGAATAYKILRTRVLQRMRANKWHSLLVTGAGPNEGKSITAANLAISVAKDVNQSAILVDLDLARPSMAEYFGLTVEAGLGEFLRGDAEIKDIVYAPDGLERLSLIPNQLPIENSSDLIASPRMHELIAWTREQNDTTLTIFDMPPVLASDDVLAFIDYVDAVLMVVSQGVTDRRELAKSVDLLKEKELLGVVLNRCSHIIGSSDYSYY